MRIGMIGLGRMGLNMARRLVRGGIEVAAYNRTVKKAQEFAEAEGPAASAAGTFVQLTAALAPPRIVWSMLPAGAPTDQHIDELLPLLAPGDLLVDGGNGFFRDDQRRAQQLAAHGIGYCDAGVSGGIWGLAEGYCIMVGGAPEHVARLQPVLDVLTGPGGNLHVGPVGAGHFVKMVHNGIEYGLMAAYAEGLNILKHANLGAAAHEVNAETAPLRHPEFYQFEIDIPQVTEVWRHASVIGSWLLDLTAAALREDPDLSRYQGRVSDSGEGRWTLLAAIDEGVPAPIISSALFARFSSRGADEFADKLMSAMRYEFGGHIEKR